jgi:hypothetical protein
MKCIGYIMKLAPDGVKRYYICNCKGYHKIEVRNMW